MRKWIAGIALAMSIISGSIPAKAGGPTGQIYVGSEQGNPASPVAELSNCTLQSDGNYVCQLGAGTSSASQYPANAIPLVRGATGTTGSTSAFLPAATGKTTYVCGYTIDAIATVATFGNATLTGVGTITRLQPVSALSSEFPASTFQNFNPCLSATATATVITIASAAAGSGGSTAVSIWGYQQ